jgi:ribosomal protein S18 acetylase RimI-like enzyme
MYEPPISSIPTEAPVPSAIRTHPNVKRLQFGDNAETIATLEFLASQGINTTALVTQHIMKYGSRARIAQTDDGQIVGFAMFDNEIDQEQLRDMATYTHPKEIKEFVDSKPFIFLQLLIMSPQFAASTNWKEELVAQFCECVTRNSKIAIARTESDNEDEIEFYRSCGFFTMRDMGIPSYPSSKGTDISILAYTPLGNEGTSQIFKKFYSMGARF